MTKRLMVVDDEFQIRELVSMYFRSLGYEVESAGSGSEGLQMIHRLAPGLDLVILDLDLGDAFGMDLIPQIKQIRPDLPIVLFTGLEMEEDLEARGLAAGADGFVLKTKPPSEIREEIEKVLAKYSTD